MSSSEEVAPDATKPTIPMDLPRSLGTVKWFSNRSSFGFVSSDQEGADDVFVHKSSIHARGFRSLKEGMVIEYTVGIDDSGRPKAEHVTAPGGGYISLPPRRTTVDPEGEEEEGATSTNQEGTSAAPKRRRARRGAKTSKKVDADDLAGDEDVVETTQEGDDKNNNTTAANGGEKITRPSRSGRAAKKSAEAKTASFWHNELSESVKDYLVNEKKFSLKLSAIDVALNDLARIKLGNEGYSTCVHLDGYIAEGTFILTDADAGTISFTWERCIALEGNDADDTKQWVTIENVSSKVPSTMSLLTDNISTVNVGDDVAKAWHGDETVPDPRKILQTSGFAMRRVRWVPDRRRIPLNRRRTGGGRGDGTAAAPKETASTLPQSVL
mmetsp:Transcript_18238/g.25946  ORF Transcript_18238/g.25946 Transcript_18238/m.25946 type:complete len:383 (-) Transcript_18238:246-1394(-)